MSETQTQSGQVPTMLKVLCILTFIGSGLSALMYLLLIIGLGAVLANIPGAASMGGVGGGTVMLIVGLILAAASIYGAIQMMKLKKLGFFIYTGAQVIMLILGPIMGGGFSFVGLIITAVFVVLYALNLKSMQ